MSKRGFPSDQLHPALTSAFQSIYGLAGRHLYVPRLFNRKQEALEQAAYEIRQHLAIIEKELGIE